MGIEHLNMETGGSSSTSSSGHFATPSPMLDKLPEDGSVVKLRGLPFRASLEDVLRFFLGFELTTSSIYFKRHPDGRPSGEAFVVFDSPEEAQRACQKDRETFGDKFGDRYVRVYPTLESDLADMHLACQQQHMVQQGHSHMHLDSVVKMKSLPFDATQLDIIHFFEAYKLKPNGVQLVVRSDNKPTGEAFVDFESYEEAACAMREKDHKVFNEKFGDRYVRLIQVSRKEMQATLALRFGGEGILKVKGIPFKAGGGDVRKFFVGYKIKPSGVSFIMHADGRPTGMAFVEFETPQEAVRAMEKDRAKFGPEYGDRFCMLQLVGRHEMDKVQLQHESEINPKNGTNGMNGGGMNGLNGLNAAALALQALAAANPALLLSQSPWLAAGHMHQQFMSGMPGGNGSAGVPQSNAAALPPHFSQMHAAAGNSTTGAFAHLDQAQLQQLAAQHFNGANGINSLAHHLNSLNLLQQQQAGVGVGVPTSAAPSVHDPSGGWLPSGPADGSMMFYQPNGVDRTASGPWGDARSGTVLL